MLNSNPNFSLVSLTQKVVSQSFRQRVTWIKTIFLIGIFFVLFQSLKLQTYDRPDLEKRSLRYVNNAMSIKLQRGPIYNAENDLLAVSLPLDSIFAIPTEIKTPADTAAKLSKILQKNEERLYKKLTAKVTFTWLLRNVKPSMSEKIRQLDLEGIHFIKEFQRFYPYKNHASQLIGFSGIDSQGLEGLEHQFNSHLMDNTPHRNIWNYWYKNPEISSMSGGSLKLTLRSKLQYITKRELGKAMRKMKAKQGTAIIMESQTGKILSMTNLPDYDPNNFSNFNNTTWRNQAVQATYEPGSTFKVITMASALQSNSIEKEDYFDCENGEWQIQDRVIHDVAEYGWLSLEKIIQKSSNICAAKIGQRIPKPVFYQMIRNFGFGSKTGIELPGEASGKVHNYQKWTNTDIATISYGYTISATPIQVITAINSIATGGILIKPSIIEEVRRSNNELIEQSPPSRKRVLNKEIAEIMKKYMISVTQKGGTGYSARIDGLTIAGKTGTSRKFNRKKNEYSSKNHIVSFVGFFPAENPVLTILVVINEPQHEYLNRKSAAPVFKKIAEYAIRYYPGDISTDSVKSVKHSIGADLFKPIAISSKETKNDKSYSKRIRKILLNKTLREALAIADRENLKIRVKGSGRVKNAVITGTKKNTLVVELH